MRSLSSDIPGGVYGPVGRFDHWKISETRNVCSWMNFLFIRKMYTTRYLELIDSVKETACVHETRSRLSFSVIVLRLCMVVRPMSALLVEEDDHGKQGRALVPA